MNSDTTQQLQPEKTADEAVSHEVDLVQTTRVLLGVLDARSKDIVTRRYGLHSENRETLEKIGQEYGITRERVRQIEANAKKALAALEDIYKPVSELLSRLFADHGGILSEQHAVKLTAKEINQNIPPNVVRFYLDILPGFTYVSNEQLFSPHWRHRPSLYPQADAVVAEATEILKKNNRPLPLNTLTDSVQARLGNSLPATTIQATLEASKNISPTAFSDWGLIGWAETSPRGVGDKAFAVLRRHDEPAHFRAITTMINEARFDGKTANPQTVHNELIKDSRFVLVGRGLYGLKEWGYIAGTVADVLEAILRKAGEPMTREDLIDRVLKQRVVKKNTILLSLQNSKQFEKTAEGKYALREQV